MKTAAFTACLKERLERNFDFYDAEAFQAFPVYLFAKHKRSSEKFFFTKRIQLYRIENFEYIVVTETEQLTLQQLEDFFRKTRAAVEAIIKPTSEHMSSIVTLVILTANPIDVKVTACLQKMKYHKDFLFTLRGWADLALVAVSLADSAVYANSMGKKVMQPYVDILKEYASNQANTTES